MGELCFAPTLWYIKAVSLSVTCRGNHRYWSACVSTRDDDDIHQLHSRSSPIQSFSNHVYRYHCLRSGPFNSRIWMVLVCCESCDIWRQVIYSFRGFLISRFLAVSPFDAFPQMVCTFKNVRGPLRVIAPTTVSTAAVRSLDFPATLFCIKSGVMQQLINTKKHLTPRVSRSCRHERCTFAGLQLINVDATYRIQIMPEIP